MMHPFIYGAFLLACLSSGDIMAADDHVDPSAVPSQSVAPVIDLRDRAFIAIQGTNNHLHLIDKTTGEEITKIELSTPVHIPPHYYSPKIFFTTDDKYMMVEIAYNNQSFIKTINLATSKIERNTAIHPKILEKYSPTQLSLSFINSTQAFYTGTVEGSDFVFVMNIVTGDLEEAIKIGEGIMLIGVNGKWATYRNRKNYNIYKINLETKEESLVVEAFKSGSIQVMPDGVRLAFYSRDYKTIQVISLDNPVSDKPVIYTFENARAPEFLVDPNGQYILFNHLLFPTTYRVFNLLSGREEEPIILKEPEGRNGSNLAFVNGPELIFCEQQNSWSSPSFLIHIINLQTRQVREVRSLSFKRENILAVHTPPISNRQIQLDKARAQQQQGNFVDVNIITGGERAAVEPMNRGRERAAVEPMNLEDWRHSVVDSARTRPNRQALEEAFNNMPNWWHDADNIYFLDGLISGADSSLRNFLSTKRDEGKKMYQELNK